MSPLCSVKFKISENNISPEGYVQPRKQLEYNALRI